MHTEITPALYTHTCSNDTHDLPGSTHTHTQYSIPTHTHKQNKQTKTEDENTTYNKAACSALQTQYNTGCCSSVRHQSAAGMCNLPDVQSGTSQVWEHATYLMFSQAPVSCRNVQLT